MASERVLVVDDEPTVRDVVRRYLERDGFQVRLAGDGDEALTSFQRDQPDLIVLDIMLPGMNGLEVCRQVRAAGSTPIILLSARGHRLFHIVAPGRVELHRPWDIAEYRDGKLYLCGAEVA